MITTWAIRIFAVSLFHFSLNISLLCAITPPPSPCGDSVGEERSKNIFSLHSSDEEEDKGRDLPYSRRDKYDFDPSRLPSIGNVTFTESKNSVRLTNDVAVRIPSL